MNKEQLTEALDEVPIVPAAQTYYDRLDTSTAVQIAYERIVEWDYDADPHGYCHERSVLLSLARAAAREHLACNTVDAARRFASLTSPETIERHARVYHKRWLEDSDGWYPEAWDDLEDEDRQWYLDLSEAQLVAVLRSVEET